MQTEEERLAQLAAYRSRQAGTVEKRGLDLVNDLATLAASVPVGVGVNYLSDKLKSKGSEPATPKPKIDKD